MATRGLGKGLDSLIPANIDINRSSKKGSDAGSVRMLPISDIYPDESQPRTNFDEEELQELSRSIKEHGIIQPILVYSENGHYTIIAGERRWRAAKVAELTEIPALVHEFSRQERLEIQLIENIQREKLNPIDEAKAYKRLLTEFGMTQEQLAESIGKSRTAITNTIRLLNLDERVQDMIAQNTLTQGHARAILAVEDKDAQLKLAQEAVQKNLSVRETEKLSKSGSVKKDKAIASSQSALEALKIIYRELENNMRECLGTKVNVKPGTNDSGKIEIEYYSQDDLENIVNMITHSQYTH